MTGKNLQETEGTHKHRLLPEQAVVVKRNLPLLPPEHFRVGPNENNGRMLLAREATKGRSSEAIRSTLRGNAEEVAAGVTDIESGCAARQTPPPTAARTPCAKRASHSRRTTHGPCSLRSQSPHTIRLRPLRHVSCARRRRAVARVPRLCNSSVLCHFHPRHASISAVKKAPQYACDFFARSWRPFSRNPNARRH